MPHRTLAEQISSTQEIPDNRARQPIRETPDKNKSTRFYPTGFIRMLFLFDKEFSEICFCRGRVAVPVITPNIRVEVRRWSAPPGALVDSNACERVGRQLIFR